jgi:hypothetical protein
MMTAIAVWLSGGLTPLWHELSNASALLFWLMLGGFVWVVGDLFQQYAVKYAGITRGVPLSNTNQLWGLLWGILVFGELQGGDPSLYLKVIGGSLVMALGALVIALASVKPGEHERWKAKAAREAQRYGVDPEFTRARALGLTTGSAAPRRSWADWGVVSAATLTLAGFALLARTPELAFDWGWSAALLGALLVALVGCGLALWRVTRFS